MRNKLIDRLSGGETICLLIFKRVSPLTTIKGESDVIVR